MSALAATIRDANASLIKDGNIEDIDRYFSDKYVVHFGGSKKTGYGGVRGFTNSLHKAFSDVNVDVEIFVESGNRISWQRRIHGMQTGAFQGFPASGRKITWRDMVVSQIEGGRIVEEWVVSDLAEALLRTRKG